MLFRISFFVFDSLFAIIAYALSNNLDFAQFIFGNLYIIFVFFEKMQGIDVRLWVDAVKLSYHESEEGMIIGLSEAKDENCFFGQKARCRICSTPRFVAFFRFVFFPKGFGEGQSSRNFME